MTDPRFAAPDLRRPRPRGARLAVVAAVLAAIPLVLSRLDGDADLDPFFAILVVGALLVAAIATSTRRGRTAFLATRLIATAWIGAALVAAVLLGMYQAACGCSRPDPASLPPLSTALGLPATAFHVLATYGGGLLVAIVAFTTTASPAGLVSGSRGQTHGVVDPSA